ncbi:M60 family metallopeptidase [Streptomyces sp. NBC_01387]|uniref:M60 family metallopeptidase n=1 Tax=unclassified Streptomyces TaxID=2593676 RepID=UPI00202522A2|nr:MULTISPECIES: M60 family metallopeptidase [unclassified Streptomyces]MCX4553744.1 M60 family metallopeptidase [Streptomyces sp. NBC_01500]
MRPAHLPATTPVTAPTAAPTAFSRRSALAALVGAGAVTLLGAGTASAHGPADHATHHSGGDTLLLTAFPDAETERLRLDRSLRASEFIPTGHYAAPGTEVTVQVRPSHGVLPVLHIGTFDDYNENVALKTPRTFPLHAGRNTVSDSYGGPVYLSFAGHGQRAEFTFVSGTVRMAGFELGRTTEAEFQKQLDTLTEVPWVELTTEHAILTLTREGALLYRDEDHAALLRLFDTIIDSHNRISGLDGSTALNRPKAGRYHFNEVSIVPKGVGAYAWHGFNGFPRAYMDRLCTVTGLRTRGWGLYHELGHLNQQAAYQAGGLTEVTVNIYSLAAQRTLGQPSNLLTKDATTGLNWFQSSAPKLGAPGIAYETTFGPYEQLVPLRQLELAFGDDFWPKLHKLVRTEHQHDAPVEDYDHDPALEARQYRALSTYASRVAGHDLTDFFVNKWAFPIDATGIAEIAALRLPAPPVDPSTLSD